MHFLIILMQAKNRHFYICLTLTHSTVFLISIWSSRQKLAKLMADQFTKATVDKVAECHILTTVETKAC